MLSPSRAWDTLISDSGLQNCDNKFCGFKSPSLWCFVQQLRETPTTADTRHPWGNCGIGPMGGRRG